MRIVIQDKDSGKEYMIQGSAPEWEIFQRSKGKKVNGVLKGKGDWVTCRHYPTTLPAAVNKVLNWLLADPDEPTEFCVEADKAGRKIAGQIQNKLRSIMLQIEEAEDATADDLK